MPAASTPNGYVAAAQAGELFHVSPKTISRWAQQGKLPFQRTLGGHRRYSVARLQELVDRLRVEATEEREGATS